MKLRLLTTSLLALHAFTSAQAIDPASLRETASKLVEESPVIRGKDGWLYLPAELRHIAAGPFWGESAAAASRATRPENADPLPAILDFKKQLDSAGIELILVPVPAKAIVYPEPLMEGESDARLDEVHQEFFKILGDNGVEVIDLLPDFLAARKEGGPELYCKTDSHWSGRGALIAAKKIAAKLGDKDWLKGDLSIETEATDRTVEVEGDLSRMLESDKPGMESLPLRVITDAATGTTVQSSQESPLILLGDSHNLIFHSGGDMLASGAGLPDQLAHELGIPVDLIGVRGSGATPARVNLMRRVRGNADYLATKKVVVWCFTVRELTEATGWNLVPVVQ